MDRDIPVRINGDDIVFRARPEVVDRWKEGVSQAGLVLSQGKTIVESRYFTLNSTLFKAGPKGPRLVPFIRSKALFGIDDDDSVASLRGRFYSFCPGYGSSRRSRARVVFLRENSGWIRKSCRSLTAGLGIQVEPEVIAESGMLSRELRYLEEVEKPLPNLKTEWGHMPEGYHLRWVDKDTKRNRAKDKGLEAAFIEAAWRPRLDGVAWKSREEVYCRGLDLSDAVVLRTKGWTIKMVRLSHKLLKKFYGDIKDYYRYIKTRWSRVQRSLLVARQKKMFPCWFANNESRPELLFHRGDYLGSPPDDWMHNQDKVYKCQPLPTQVNGFLEDSQPEDLLVQANKDASFLTGMSMDVIMRRSRTMIPPPADLTDGNYIVDGCVVSSYKPLVTERIVEREQPLLV